LAVIPLKNVDSLLTVSLLKFLCINAKSILITQQA